MKVGEKEHMAYKKIEPVSEDFFQNNVNKENKELIEDFLSQSHLSKKTLKQYKSSLYIFAKYIHDNLRNKEITSLKPRDALRYQNYLIDIGLSENAIKFKRSTVSSLCGFIELYYDDEYPNFRNIFTKSIPNVEKSNLKIKNPLTKDEIEMLVNSLKADKDWQKLAYLLFSYSSGCRREEARQLKKEVADYDRHVAKDGTVKNYYKTHDIRAKGKGQKGKVRFFTFDEEAMKAIREWVDVRRQDMPNDDCEYLFVSKRNGKYKQVSENTFNLWCNKFSKILGGRPVHPHLIRSSTATNQHDEGKSIESIQKLLGHNSSETTQIYIVRDDSDDLDELYE